MELSKLKEPFPASRISWRVGSTTADKSKGMALAYIDARDVQDRLDEVCGVEGWQCRYVPMHDKKTVCEIGIRMTPTNLIFRGEGLPYDMIPAEWVWKSDGAGDTDVEAEKGSLSDAFKRAAVRWGIGRYLYDVEAPWVELEPAGRSYKIAAKEYARLESILNRSKPLPKPQAQPVTAASEPVPTPVPTTTPAEWATKAIARVKGFTTRKDLDDFEEKYHLKISKIRPVEPDLHEKLVAAIRAKHSEFAE